MRAGELNHRIIIQTATETSDSYGGVTQTWADTHTVWAARLHKGSREFYAAQKVNAETTDLFKIRYLSGVTSEMRLVDAYDNNKIFDIIGTWEGEGRRQELYILCKAVV
jgi:SPP1 family predicted phage head-tail adaptor